MSHNIKTDQKVYGMGSDPMEAVEADKKEEKMEAVSHKKGKEVKKPDCGKTYKA